MSVDTKQFQTAEEMRYVFNEHTINKSESLIKNLITYLPDNEKKDRTLFLKKDETAYIPDLHGDFVHLIITLYRHDAIDKDLNLKSSHDYVFLGDFYDRAPDSDVTDYWLNKQIRKGIKIYRLIGNHEMAFFERDENGYPLIFPSQDSIRDISKNFQITENILKNIANGSIIAAFADCKETLYVHSYVINDDYIELGLKENSDVTNFAILLNKRLKQNGELAYDDFCKQKKEGTFNWKKIMRSFNDDPLFNIYNEEDDISASFIWRRTGLPQLNVYPSELEADIPENVYQIVGHTPVFFFNLPNEISTKGPFVLSAKKGNGKVQFSDVGIGYYYRNDFERPNVIINKNLAALIY